MSARKCWAVSSGSYSDYSVSAIFANEADAQAHADHLNADDGWSYYGVEEIPYYAEGGKPTMRTIWVVCADELEPTPRVSHTRKVPEYDGDVPTYKRPKLSVNTRYRDGVAYWDLTGRALSREGAMKVVADRVAEIKAGKAGIA